MIVLAHILFVIGFLLSISMLYISKRRWMLVCGIVYSLCYAASFFLQGAEAGGWASLIAASGILINVFTPDSKLKETFKVRLSILVGFCILSALYAIEDLLDIFSYLGMVGARFSEALDTSQKIRIGYALSGFIWLCYIWSTGIVLVITLETIRWISTLMAIFVFHHKRKMI